MLYSEKSRNVLSVGWKEKKDGEYHKVRIAVGKTDRKGRIRRYWFEFDNKEDLIDTISQLQKVASKMK